MIIQDIYLKNYDWKVRVYYAVDRYYIPDILNDLIQLDCEDKSFYKIKELMESGKLNIGFTYSNIDKRESIILIGITDSADEFQSTFDHEKGHLAMHICSALHIEPFSEEYQYLTGEIGKQMFKEAKNFMCEHCRKYIL